MTFLLKLKADNLLEASWCPITFCIMDQQVNKISEIKLKSIVEVFASNKVTMFS